MATGANIENRGHIVGFKEEISKASEFSEKSFFTWFNSADDKEEAFVRGNWDFAYHIAMPSVKYLSKPHSMAALEIGYGGGRILSAASHFFDKVFGVDIHSQGDLVRGELEKRGAKNVVVFQTDGSSIPLDDCSIDFVYSFIVLQHVEKIAIFKQYIDEIQRVLKDGGIAVIYFGRNASFSLNKSKFGLYLLDLFYERISMKKGYEEVPARVNEVNLKVTLPLAKRITKKAKFKVLKALVSRKRVPDGSHLYGGQHGLVLKKIDKKKL